MPKRIIQSAANAYAGLRYALKTERNLPIFVATYLVFSIIALRLSFTSAEWALFLFSGGFFASIELLNTALERIADAMDDHCKREHRAHCFTAIKHAKDIGAAASLVSLLVVGCVLLILFLPHLMPFIVLPR